MTHENKSPDAMKARGFLRLALVFAVIGLFLLTAEIIAARDVPRTFAATDVTVDDFTKGTKQAILTGTMQVRQTRLDLADATEMSLRLSGGSSMTVFTPFTDADWTPGEPVDVIIVSPSISGVTPQTTQISARDYMNELQARPDNILVTLLPSDQQIELARDQNGIDGIWEQTLFVWPDHVNSINYAPVNDSLGFLKPAVTFLVALVFLIASRVFAARAKRV